MRPEGACGASVVAHRCCCAARRSARVNSFLQPLCDCMGQVATQRSSKALPVPLCRLGRCVM